MQRKTILKIVTTLSTIVLIIMFSTYTFAGITPSQITGTDIINKDDLGFIYDISDFVKWIGTFIAVGALMVIGIKYITGSIEEKANYKKSMMPYIIGCFILFGASFIIPAITETFTDLGTDNETIGNKILGLIQMIGTFVSVGALMILGIKYMMGSAEQKASYKKSMMPYLVGAVLLFGAVNITSIIYDVTINTGIAQFYDAKPVEAAKRFVDNLKEQYGDDTETIKDELQKELNDAERKRLEAQTLGPDSEEAKQAFQYWEYILGEFGKMQ